MMNKNVTDAGFERDMEVVASPNYLGDSETVEWLLRNYISQALQRFDPEKKDESVQSDISDALALADIFLGKDERYPAVPAWNKEGAIDVWLREQGVNRGSTPREIVATAIVQCLAAVYRLYNQSVMGELEENWGFQVGGVVERTARLLLGIPEFDNPPGEEPDEQA